MSARIALAVPNEPLKIETRAMQMKVLLVDRPAIPNSDLIMRQTIWIITPKTDYMCPKWLIGPKCGDRSRYNLSNQASEVIWNLCESILKKKSILFAGLSVVLADQPFRVLANKTRSLITLPLKFCHLLVQKTNLFLWPGLSGQTYALQSYQSLSGWTKL